MTFAATILTLYPEMFPGSLGMSLAGRALERGDWSCETVHVQLAILDGVAQAGECEEILHAEPRYIRPLLAAQCA